MGLSCLTVSFVVSAQALDVSDHYSVEVLLKNAANKVSFSGVTFLLPEKAIIQNVFHLMFMSLFLISHLVF